MTVIQSYRGLFTYTHTSLTGIVTVDQRVEDKGETDKLDMNYARLKKYSI